MDPSTLALIALVLLHAFEATWIWYQATRAGPQRTKGLVNTILDERFGTGAGMKGGMDPRDLVASREQKEGLVTAEIFEWLVQTTGDPLRARTIWAWIPEEIKRKAVKSGLYKWRPVLEPVVRSFFVQQKPASATSPQQQGVTLPDY